MSPACVELLEAAEALELLHRTPMDLDEFDRQADAALERLRAAIAGARKECS